MTVGHRITLLSSDITDVLIIVIYCLILCEFCTVHRCRICIIFCKFHGFMIVTCNISLQYLPYI